MNLPKARRFLILVHLYLASILAPSFILVGITGALHILGDGESVTSEAINVSAGTDIDFDSPKLDQDVRAFLDTQNIDMGFEYLVIRGSSIFTRPTSRPHLQIQNSPSGVMVTKKTPNLQYSLMELHKGHGPRAFRYFQAMAGIALFFIILGGITIGLLAQSYRKQTIYALLGGVSVFSFLAFIV